ncbi:acid phosphatase [Dactylonectria estremocensis]|uniref:Acid phosphatase n=1 Tax=Dactylonectria estremocensis TaxID=1079267 RepID=A0A9P9ETD6_9HYPO|nr:acid phosphatase [Dactylonectria estremocensis]
MPGRGTCSAAASTYTKNGLKWSHDALRMNQVQVVGTHNSYHREATAAEKVVLSSRDSNAQNLFYSHPALDIQASYQAVRSFEIDVFADPEGGHYAMPWIRQNDSTEPIADLDGVGIKVLHMADLDYHATCHTLKGCLKVVKAWSDAHPKHVPIPFMIEFKTSESSMVSLGGASLIPWNNATLLKGLDDEIRSVFKDDRLIVPDDIRRGKLTLEESVLKYGWPNLESVRGRVLFFMDNGPVNVVRDAYIEDRPNLEGRVLFTNSAPGNPDCAFQKLNDPTGDNLANIQEQVKLGYWVRTRADVPLTTLFADNVTAQREAAFSSGAQIVSTDFQAYGMSSRWEVDYAARLDGGLPARCNPVTAPKTCKSNKLEKEAYYRN